MCAKDIKYVKPKNEKKSKNEKKPKNEKKEWGDCDGCNVSLQYI